ncbi:MAG: signal peptidase I [Cytophagaceae bacterium]|jgi:signal peptidase I|nr:signal peptidase I [Cytophagaceae bacterium]
MATLVSPALIRRVQYNTIDLLFNIIVLLLLTNFIPVFHQLPSWLNILLFGGIGLTYELLFFQLIRTTPGQDIMSVFLRKHEERNVHPDKNTIIKRFLLKYYLAPFVILSILLDKERRGLHDKLCGTVLLEVEVLKGQKRKYQSVYQEWGDSISFAVVVATFIRWFWLEPYTIPTGSMEKSLLIGDFLFVNKLSYGTRAPMTPIQLPLTHQKVWGTEWPSFSSAVELPYFRLPGYSSIKNNDVVVFNFPNENYPTDLKTNYIKRCIAIPGDSIKIVQRDVYINGTKVAPKPTMQWKYICYTNKHLSNFTRKKYNIHWDDVYLQEETRLLPMEGNKTAYIINFEPAMVEKLKMDKVFDSILPATVQTLRTVKNPHNEGHILNSFGPVYPYAENAQYWEADNFGSLWVPKKGVSIPLTPKNVMFYSDVIARYEIKDSVRIENQQLIVNGEVLQSYTFTKNYYFMMGDNRHHSFDGRFWGFVPEDHIVGKASMVWFSLDSELPFPERIRWNRMFRFIH